MSREKTQRDILFEVCKQIATNKRTPGWIQGMLREAVEKAKNVPDDVFDGGLDKPIDSNEPFKVGDVAYCTHLDNVLYKFKITSETDTVDGVRLFNVQVIDGNGPHAGRAVYNMPETWLRHTKE